ncbi:Inosine/uridine-preferring nucleoside hydrolase [Gloeothece citriformis PCC 7424]|uniref:Inosine/uridine-preferring nucleoside hydrolase n=1 Tax=Gloeothece citriformis (strain PCC 7424) TaxID=65393 RepID=B7KEQ9_GLOC7|nr:nucleoside hydrolase [Gloeothece citriformis]ACK69084.1 Inosine/uridine-preferring nucleoside hydrolase [Gloeothece citriformis PCC 7424]
MTNPNSNPMPLIVDDDGSQDGMTALVYLLQNPKFEVKAITISQGIAYPKIFGTNLMRMLARLGKTGIPVGVGSETPLEGNNSFPEQFREESNSFWSPFVSLPNQALETLDSRDAATLIIDTIQQSPKPVTILATGSLTNIAEALRQEPTIINNIASLHIMGGAVFVPGNLREHLDPMIKQNQVAEFNIWVDPIAAQEVFKAASAGLKIILTTLDATNQVGFSRGDQQAWKATGTPEGIIASEFLDFALSVISGNDPLIPNPVWDLVAAINLSEPSFCNPVPLHIQVDTMGKPNTTQGQTVVIENQPPNTYVCLNPSFNNLKFGTNEIFTNE